MSMGFISVLVVYYAVVLSIGLWKFRRQTKAQYITAPGSTGFLVLMFSLLGTIVGGGMFLGVAQIGYSDGMTCFALGISYFVGLTLMGFLAPTFRRLCKEKRVHTLIGFLEDLYPSTSRFSVATVFTAMTFLVFLVMLAAQFLGVASFVSYYTNIKYEVAIIYASSLIAVMSIFACTAFGGFRRDIWADVIQVSFTSLGVIAIIYSGVFDVGISDDASIFPKDFFAIKPENLSFFVFSLCFIIPTFIVRFDLWQRMITAKSDLVARNAFITSGTLSVIFFGFFGMLGVYGRSMGLPASEHIALEVIRQHVSGASYWLATTAFFAAVMSASDTFLNVTSLAFAKLTIFQMPGSLESQQTPEDEKGFVSRVRWITIGVGILAILIAFLMKSIVGAFAFAFGVLMVFLPAIGAGLSTDVPDELSAKWSSVIGMIALLIGAVIFGAKYAWIPGLSSSVVAYFVIHYVVLPRKRV